MCGFRAAEVDARRELCYPHGFSNWVFVRKPQRAEPVRPFYYTVLFFFKPELLTQKILVKSFSI